MFQPVPVGTESMANYCQYQDMPQVHTLMTRLFFTPANFFLQHLKNFLIQFRGNKNIIEGLLKQEEVHHDSLKEILHQKYQQFEDSFAAQNVDAYITFGCE